MKCFSTVGAAMVGVVLTILASQGPTGAHATLAPAEPAAGFSPQTTAFFRERRVEAAVGYGDPRVEIEPRFLQPSP